MSLHQRIERELLTLGDEADQLEHDTSAHETETCALCLIRAAMLDDRYLRKALEASLEFIQDGILLQEVEDELAKPQ